MAAFAIIASLILAGLSSYSGRNDGYPNVTIDNYHSGDWASMRLTDRLSKAGTARSLSSTPGQKR